MGGHAPAGRMGTALAEKNWSGGNGIEFFKKRAGKAMGDGLMNYLKNAPDAPPETQDEVR